MLHRLVNTVQRYPWGSPDALVRLYGLSNPRHEPLAELWMGAHPKAPSRIVTPEGEQGLDAYIAGHPEQALGPVAAEYGTELPFLFKILCAARPLSIQVHPSLDQARRGFDAENAAGVPLDSPLRNYRDPNHKPELICAIEPFWGLRGFRSVDEIRDEFTTVEFNKGDTHLSLPQSEEDLAGFVRQQLQISQPVRRDLIAAAVSLAGGRWPTHRSGRLPEVGDPLARYYWVLRIAEEYPGDIGVLAPLVFNVFSLRPGEATYQPAGVLHAYLCGVGAELMANSDNVLRGGMTGKHIDVDELLSIGRFRSEPAVILPGTPETTLAPASCRTFRYPTPFREFELARILPSDACTIPGGSPQILFCHRGPVLVLSGGAEVTLAAGESVFVDAAEDAVEIVPEGAVAGPFEVFRARVPE